MNCPSVQKLLSNYYDGELPPESSALVERHVETCTKCSKLLATFTQLSWMAGRLATPAAPEMWSELETRLEAAQPNPRESSRRRWAPAIQLLALAASVLVVVGVGWTVSSVWRGPENHEAFSAGLDEYLADFQRSPVAAQAALISAYGGTALDADQALEQVGFRPAVSQGLPAGYTVVSTHMLDMPCCRCVQSLCKSNDGTMFAVFEHHCAQEDSFTDRPAAERMCNGKPCKLVELDHRIAASWKLGHRHMTVVGLRDVDQLEALVASLDKPTT